jgi:tRNA(Ile2) C34 agmatinyltransferase TiaS
MMVKTLCQVTRLVLILTPLFASTLTCPECGGTSWSNGPGYHQLTCNDCGFVYQE